MTLAALVIATHILAAPHTIELPRLPRLEAKADVDLWRRAAPERRVFGRDRRPLFVRAGDSDAIAALERVGVRAELGDWVPVRLDDAALRELLGGVGRTELRAAPAHRPMLDISLPETRASQVHSGGGGSQRRDGSGVLVGVIDTGLDLSHPAFRRPDGSSRVVAIWDQDATSGQPPQRFGYGRLCGVIDIAADGCGVSDPSGHGTHVTGIAAGVDGIAPGAEIALVRSATFTHLADAVLFLTDLAEDRDQPIAINISVGGHYGAHDGRTPLESYLAKLLGPGQIAVAAAGNDGADRLHLGVDLSEAPQRVSIDNIPWGKPSEIIIELWGTSVGEVELVLELWVEGELVVDVPLSAHGDEYLDGEITFAGQPVAMVGYGAEIVPDSGRARRTVVIDTSGVHGPPEDGRLALSLSGQGRLDGWLSQSDYRFGVARFGRCLGEGWIAGDGESSITVPATSASIIAVGSYWVRDQWTSDALGEQSIGPIPFGSLSSYSSRGPTLDPIFTGIKPDLIAPGSMIASARSVDVPSGFNTLDGGRVLRQGTSMAAPHVTGTLALMLEADPNLTPDGAREALRQTARFVDPPNDEVGFGKLDALAAVEQAELGAPGCAALSLSWLSGLAVAGLLGSRRRRYGA